MYVLLLCSGQTWLLVCKTWTTKAVIAESGAPSMQNCPCMNIRQPLEAGSQFIHCSLGQVSLQLFMQGGYGQAPCSRKQLIYMYMYLLYFKMVSYHTHVYPRPDTDTYFSVSALFLELTYWYTHVFE